MMFWQVRDFKEYSRNCLLGEIRAPLSCLQTSNPFEMLEDLQRPRKVLYDFIKAISKIIYSLLYTRHRNLWDIYIPGQINELIN